MAAAAGEMSLFRCRGIKLEQLTQHSCSSLMHRRTNRDLYRFQIQRLLLLARAEKKPQQMFYFAGDFLLDDFRRFFFARSSSGWSGRTWQIFSLISNNSCAS